MASSGRIVFIEDGFKGKVIDTETLEPIEGAVVVALYRVSVYGFIKSDSHTTDIRETLTDSNGEFTIPRNIFFYLWPLSSGDKTRFIIFKPGYGAYPGHDTFLIYAVKETSLRRIGTKITKKKLSNKEETMPENNITNKNENKLYRKNSSSRLRKGSMATEDSREGIVFEKSIRNKRGQRLYREKYGGNWLPFIPLKDPFEKVRNLDLPFDADVFNVEKIFKRRIWTYYREPFKTYPIIGLPKIKTLQERKNSYHSADKIPDRFENKAPIWEKMLDDEYNYITKEVR